MIAGSSGIAGCFSSLRFYDSAGAEIAMNVKSTSSSSYWPSYEASKAVGTQHQAFCSATNTFKDTNPVKKTAEWVQVVFNSPITFSSYSFLTYGGYNIGRFQLQALKNDRWETLHTQREDVIWASMNGPKRTFMIYGGKFYLL